MEYVRVKQYPRVFNKISIVVHFVQNNSEVKKCAQIKLVNKWRSKAKYLEWLLFKITSESLKLRGISLVLYSSLYVNFVLESKQNFSRDSVKIYFKLAWCLFYGFGYQQIIIICSLLLSLWFYLGRGYNVCFKCFSVWNFLQRVFALCFHSDPLLFVCYNVSWNETLMGNVDDYNDFFFPKVYIVRMVELEISKMIYNHSVQVFPKV